MKINLDINFILLTFVSRKTTRDMKSKGTTYIGKIDATVETVVLENGNVCYLHHKDGATSLLPNLESLLKFIDGDKSVRMGCFPTEIAVETMQGFEKIFE